MNTKRNAHYKLFKTHREKHPGFRCTLILSYGKLTGGSALTRKLAKKHNRPWVHVDLDTVKILERVIK
jgi:hypothetical protein